MKPERHQSYVLLYFCYKIHLQFEVHLVLNYKYISCLCRLCVCDPVSACSMMCRATLHFEVCQVRTARPSNAQLTLRHNDVLDICNEALIVNYSPVRIKTKDTLGTLCKQPGNALATIQLSLGRCLKPPYAVNVPMRS